MKIENSKMNEYQLFMKPYQKELINFLFMDIDHK